MKTEALRLVSAAGAAAVPDLRELLGRLTDHRLTVRTSNQRLHVHPDPPEEMRGLLARHGRLLYRILSRWGDGFGMAMLHALHELPQAPFQLHPGVKVIDADRFAAALLRDALQGPKGPRGDSVEADVRALILYQPIEVGAPAVLGGMQRSQPRPIPDREPLPSRRSIYDELFDPTTYHV